MKMNKYIRQTRRKVIHRTLEEFQEEFENTKDDFVMEKEEILRTLVRCGLSEYESKVYSSLVILGPSKAGDVSKEAKVPQSKIYEILDNLMNKQLVEMFDGRPKEFKAADPEVALRNILEEKTAEINKLKIHVATVSGFMKPKKEEEVIGGIWTIKGEKFREFFNKASEMMKRSEKYIYAITRDFSRSYPMSIAAKECMRRGVKIRVIGMENINEKNYYRALWYKDQGIDVRCFETKVHPRIIVVDGKELLLRLDYNPQKRNRFRFNSLWSEDPSLINVMDNYVKNMWKNAKPINFKKVQQSVHSTS